MAESGALNEVATAAMFEFLLMRGTRNPLTMIQAWFQARAAVLFSRLIPPLANFWV